ncbi:hypothetical protein A4G19_14290 [Pasteurellaceae bacterium Macca]|nr:hypothetical protein [Pasteurellaceae bacterium Macca]
MKSSINPTAKLNMIRQLHSKLGIGAEILIQPTTLNLHSTLLKLQERFYLPITNNLKKPETTSQNAIFKQIETPQARSLP